jgi:hypothetical protein
VIVANSSYVEEEIFKVFKGPDRVEGTGVNGKSFFSSVSFLDAVFDPKLSDSNQSAEHSLLSDTPEALEEMYVNSTFTEMQRLSLDPIHLALQVNKDSGESDSDR